MSSLNANIWSTNQVTRTHLRLLCSSKRWLTTWTCEFTLKNFRKRIILVSESFSEGHSYGWCDSAWSSSAHRQATERLLGTWQLPAASCQEVKSRAAAAARFWWGGDEGARGAMGDNSVWAGLLQAGQWESWHLPLPSEACRGGGRGCVWLTGEKSMF